MEIQFRSRNHDMGAVLPTFQERVNSMLPVDDAQTSAAPALETERLVTPHMPGPDEVRQTLEQVEREANAQSEELINMHSGLNARRVARLLDLLD